MNFWKIGSATIKYKAEKAGTVTITANPYDMTDSNDSNNQVTGTKTFNITIKEKSNNSTSNSSGTNNNNTTDNQTSSGNTNTNTTKKPNFNNTSGTIYTVNDTTNLRSDWATTEGAIQVPKGTELKLTATSTEIIGGYTWYRVTYNGATRYVASSLITYTKPKEDKKDEDKNDDNKEDNKSSNKNLSSLSIEGIELDPKFNKETTQYAAKVDGDVTELKIDAKAEDSKAKVTVEGNKDLKEGDNVIKVKVTAEDDTTRTYFITVTQGEGTVTDSEIRLTELKIDRVDFDGIFKPDTYRYELTLQDYVKNLDITATANQPDAQIEISGNEEFKEGKNAVVILVTSADGSKTANYRIEVNVPAEVVANTEEDDDMIKYILIGVAVALAIIALILLIMHHRNGRADENEFDSEEENQIEFDRNGKIGGRRFDEIEDNDTRYSEIPSRRINSDVTVDDLFSSQEEQEREPRRPRGGRHSI